MTECYTPPRQTPTIDKPDCRFPLTAQDLIDALVTYPPNAEVVVCPWEGHIACHVATDITYDETYVVITSVKL